VSIAERLVISGDCIGTLSFSTWQFCTSTSGFCIKQVKIAEVTLLKRLC
jgi:hypothetical protein